MPYPGGCPSPMACWAYPTAGPGRALCIRAQCTSFSFFHYVAPPYSSFSASKYDLELPPEQPNGFYFYMFFIMIVIITTTFGMVYFTWLVFGMEIPIFVGSKLTIEFDVNFVVMNPNDNLDNSFRYAKSVMLYRDIRVARETAQKYLELGSKKRGSLHANLHTNASNTEVVEGFVVEDRSMNRHNGLLVFTLDMAIDAAFKSGSLWRSQIISVLL